MPHIFDILNTKVKLPKGESGDIILERRGGKMWDELSKWVDEYATPPGDYMISIYKVQTKMNEIEKQYGIDYTE